MIPFLQSIIIELTARYGSGVSDFCFVLPSRRSCTFLRRHFEATWQNNMGRLPRGKEYPKVMTIGDFTDRLTTTTPASRPELLFTLFTAWREMPTAETADFDRFRTWGETLMSDFNEVDMYDVDAKALFTNMADFNEIQTDYLTAEQREVIRRYFGVDEPEQEVARFWKHFNPTREGQKRFLSLWQLMYPLYVSFNQKLGAMNKTYPGRAFKLACERVEAEGEGLLKFPKIVFAGFNALSRIERKLFKQIAALRNAGGESVAEFFWDAPGTPLAEDSPVDAGHFLHVNAKDFPCSIPQMQKYTESLTFPEHIEVTACPGNTAQVKIITRKLESILGGTGKNYVDPARVAVVMPDEGLLFPVLYSLPESVAPGANITMGYPLKMTEIASFFSLVRLLQSRVRQDKSGARFYNKDVTSLLSHTVVRRLLGVKYCEQTLGSLMKKHQYFISSADLAGADAPVAAAVLWQPLTKEAGIDEACTYLEQLMSLYLEAAHPGMPVERQEDESSTPLEVTHIRAYIAGARELRSLAKLHGVTMDRRSALAMVDKMLASTTIPMQGEPLHGLQMMGMLETRALDFDYLIIPSMNERIFPRKMRKHTFIPDALRRGYGIATTRFQESIFAYYFYRLIARAKRVELLYDASQGGMRSGDPSRYLLQLRHLFPDSGLKWNSAQFTLANPSAASISVEKNPDIQSKLNEYLTPDSGKCLSASSLKTFMTCPMKFYLHYVEGQKVDRDPEEFMDAIAQGNVLHHSMEYIYNSLAGGREDAFPLMVTADIIRGWLEGTRPIGRYGSVQQLVQAEINKEYTKAAEDAPLSGDVAIMASVLTKYVEWVLKADLHLTPFRYIASEKKYSDILYPLPSGQTVNMTMTIDRLDYITDPSDGSANLVRLSDYKTGSDNTDFDTVPKLFTGANGAIFQLMLYGVLLPYANPKVNPGRPLALAIYKTRELEYHGFRTEITQKGMPVWSNQPYKEEFVEQLAELLKSLFDYAVPFVQTKDVTSCAYCEFRRLCGR